MDKTQARSKLAAYCEQYGDWISRRTPAQMLAAAKFLRQEIDEKESPPIAKLNTLARIVQFECIAECLEVLSDELKPVSNVIPILAPIEDETQVIVDLEPEEVEIVPLATLIHTQPVPAFTVGSLVWAPAVDEKTGENGVSEGRVARIQVTTKEVLYQIAYPCDKDDLWYIEPEWVEEQHLTIVMENVKPVGKYGHLKVVK